MTAATPSSCARFLGLAGLLLTLLGSGSAQSSSEVISAPKPPARGEQPLVLSPFVVSGDKRSWLYGTLPGFEIITRASEERTRDLLLCYFRSWLVEDAVIPAEWLQESPVPYTIIVDDTKPGTAAQSTAAPMLTPAENYDLFGWNFWGREWPPSMVFKYGTPLNGWIHAADDDTTVLGANLYGDAFMVRAPTWLDRLDRCAPSLPKWVVTGLGGPFGLFENRTHAALTLYYSSDLSPPPTEAVFRGIRWISTADSKRLKRDFSRLLGSVEIPFIPLQEFFSESPPTPEQRALWESQAGLLVRWGLIGTTGQVNLERRAQFAKFVERQKNEPVTEKMMTECFGYGYAEMERELKEYLKKTLGVTLRFKMFRLDGFRNVAFDPATPDQVGRIVGDWQRLHGASLQASQPAQAKAFLDAADQTLSRAWLRNSEWLPAPGSAAVTERKDLAAIIEASQISAGNPDPDFLAVCGLYEYDIGEYKLARDVLEISAALHTKRPKAYLLLAELRAREVTAKPEGRNGTLSVAQAAFILQPLKITLPQASTSRPWRLMVDTLMRCDSPPSVANLDVVIKGAALFPRDSSLQLDTARLCLKSGERARAMEVINQALPLAVDKKVRAEFQELRDSI